MSGPLTCKGVVRDPDQGHLRQCPKKSDCQHFANFKPGGKVQETVVYVYDFELQDCDDFLPVKSK